MAYLDVELRSEPDRALAWLALRPVTAGVKAAKILGLTIPPVAAAAGRSGDPLTGIGTP
jgi:hypothetical protein